MKILLIEPKEAELLSPIALARPVFELLCGVCNQRERILETWKPAEWGVLVRPHLAKLYQSRHPRARVNDLRWMEANDLIVINGLWAGWLPCPKSLEEFRPRHHRKVPIAFLKRKVADGQGKGEWPTFEQLAAAENWDQADELGSVEGALLRYPWDVVRENGRMIREDFDQLLPRYEADFLDGTSWKHALSSDSHVGRVRIHPTAEIEPFVSINSSAGPVIVDEGAKIQSFTRLEGPCYVGRQSELFRANLRGETSIGPVCRVGGEIEASVLHGYVNKYHDGFLGHSYVCPWVNLGALTTNSDLKNDYSTVKVPLGTDFLETGDKKVGCFIGDHSKTAIGTLLNTGSNIGAMSMVLPGGRLCPKHIPSFSRLWQGRLDDQLDFNAVCNTAAAAMGRRGRQFTPEHRQMFEQIFQLTTSERETALKRYE